MEIQHIRQIQESCLIEFRLCWRITVAIPMIDFQALWNCTNSFFSLIYSISMCFLIYIKHVKTWGVTLAQCCIVTLLKLCIPSVTSAVLRPQSVQKNWGRVHPRCWKCAASEGAASAASDLHTRPVLSTLHQRGTGKRVWPAQRILLILIKIYIFFPCMQGCRA